MKRQVLKHWKLAIMLLLFFYSPAELTRVIVINGLMRHCWPGMEWQFCCEIAFIWISYACGILCYYLIRLRRK
jgi:hypothetical protein